MNKDNPTATILEIVRMSTEDGPGIRTTVFFKGCTLKCAWCHNPESISATPELCWVGNRCIGCRTCLEACPEGALNLTEEGMVIDRTRCTSCGTCADECPGTALELLGRQWTVDELTAEVIKDRAYFETSGGGVTVSGGEPLMQAQFTAAFLKSLREKGLHTAVDTCGLCPKAALEQVLPYAAMVMFDLKIMNPQAHKRLTGHDNVRIHENLLFVADFMKSHLYPSELWIRTPIIPGATDDPANIAAIGRFIAENLPGRVKRWELCAFNNLCRDKYMRLDKVWDYAQAELVTEVQMEALAQTARKSGVDPQIVCWSGSTRLENTDKEKKDELSRHGA